MFSQICEPDSSTEIEMWQQNFKDSESAMHSLWYLLLFNKVFMWIFLALLIVSVILYTTKTIDDLFSKVGMVSLMVGLALRVIMSAMASSKTEYEYLNKQRVID